ncbi:hypothetical protein QFZ28_004343 [Neobacillus niacini]|nr:hypothetical protein [Neobacillus niacini]
MIIKLESLSLLVLETLMTECLIKMEKSNDQSFVNKQIMLFKEIQNEFQRRGRQL